MASNTIGFLSILTINRSTMVSYEKIIRFLKKWEQFVPFVCTWCHHIWAPDLYTVVPLMRDHKESPQKTVSQKGFALFGG